MTGLPVIQEFFITLLEKVAPSFNIKCLYALTVLYHVKRPD